MPLGFDPTQSALNMEVDGLCVKLELDLGLFDLCVLMPGGIDLCPDPPIIPFPGDIAGKMIAKVNAALVPFTPIFDLVELALAFIELAKDATNPQKLVTLVNKLVEKLQKFLRFYPPIALPKTIKNLVGIIIALLKQIRLDIEIMIKAQASLDLSAKKGLALGDLDLDASLECAQAGIDFQVAVIANSAEPLNRLINIINLFCQLAGLPDIPSLALNLEDSSALTAALSPLDDLIASLEAFQQSIPV